MILLLQNAISWQLTALLPRIETLANYAGGDFLQILCEQCLVSMCNEETAQGNLNTKDGSQWSCKIFNRCPSRDIITNIEPTEFHGSQEHWECVQLHKVKFEAFGNK